MTTPLTTVLLWLTLLGSLAAAPEDQPEQVDIFYKQAEEQFRKHEYDESIKTCEKALELDPNHTKALNLLGSCLVHSRDFQTARRYFQRVQDLKPNQSTAFNIAELDFLSKDWKIAKTSFEELLKEKDLKENIMAVSRFKLMIIALQMDDMEALKQHYDFFKDERMNDELRYSQILIHIHREKPDKETAMRMMRHFQAGGKNGAAYVDSILEAYYIKD